MRRLLEEFRASERHVCELMAVPRSSGRYRSRRDDSLVQERLRELTREHPRFGYRRLHLYLHKEMGVNHKKVQRVYRELGLSVTHGASICGGRFSHGRCCRRPTRSGLWTLPAT